MNTACLSPRRRRGLPHQVFQPSPDAKRVAGDGRGARRAGWVAQLPMARRRRRRTVDLDRPDICRLASRTVRHFCRVRRRAFDGYEWTRSTLDRGALRSRLGERLFGFRSASGS